MTNNGNNFLPHVTFSQRYGYEPLPEPMRLEELSDDLRREIWDVVYSLLHEDSRSYSPVRTRIFRKDTRKTIQQIWGKFKRIPMSRVSTDFEYNMQIFEGTITQKEFNLVLDFLEIMIDEFGFEFAQSIRNLFGQYGAAY